MVFDMLDQLCLGICRSGNEQGSGIDDGLGHALQEIVILGRVAAADAVGLVVDMARRIVGVQHETIDLSLDCERMLTTLRCHTDCAWVLLRVKILSC
jgi:hypothetical protein